MDRRCPNRTPSPRVAALDHDRLFAFAMAPLTGAVRAVGARGGVTSSNEGRAAAQAQADRDRPPAEDLLPASLGARTVWRVPGPSGRCPTTKGSAGRFWQRRQNSPVARRRGTIPSCTPGRRRCLAVSRGSDRHRADASGVEGESKLVEHPVVQHLRLDDHRRDHRKPSRARSPSVIACSTSVRARAMSASDARLARSLYGRPPVNRFQSPPDRAASRAPPPRARPGLRVSHRVVRRNRDAARW